MDVKMEESIQNSVVFYPSPGTIHLGPAVELAKLIIEHHHPSPISNVIFICQCLPHLDTILSLETYASKVSSSNPCISFIHLPPLEDPYNTNPYNTNPIPGSTNASLFSNDILALLFEVPKHNNRRLYETLVNLSESTSVKALVIDFFSSAAFQVGSALNIPTYGLGTVGASTMSSLLYFPYLDLENATSDHDETVPGLPPVTSKDLPTLMRQKSHKAYRYFVEAGAQMAKSAAGIIANTFEEFEPRAIKAIVEGKSCPGIAVGEVPPLFCVGPLETTPKTNTTYSNITQATAGEAGGNECLTWLESQPSRSVVFLCFGRLGTFSTRQLKEMAIGLERSGSRFLWVVRDPPPPPLGNEMELEELLPEGFLERTKERGLVVKNWAPQGPILNHCSVGGFVTHCGWSSVLEAVTAGVAMLAWPLYAEQKINRVVLVEEIKVALPVREDEITGLVAAEEVEEGVRELMESEKGRDMWKRVVELKERALKARGEGGSSRSALHKLVHSFTHACVSSLDEEC